MSSSFLFASGQLFSGSFHRWTHGGGDLWGWCSPWVGVAKLCRYFHTFRSSNTPPSLPPLSGPNRQLQILDRHTISFCLLPIYFICLRLFPLSLTGSILFRFVARGWFNFLVGSSFFTVAATSARLFLTSTFPSLSSPLLVCTPFFPLFMVFPSPFTFPVVLTLIVHFFIPFLKISPWIVSLGFGFFCFSYPFLLLSASFAFPTILALYYLPSSSSAIVSVVSVASAYHSSIIFAFPWSSVNSISFPIFSSSFCPPSSTSLVSWPRS